MNNKQVPVTKRALIQRINRKLAAGGEILKATRGEAARTDVGDYYVINDKNILCLTKVDLVSLGRKLGVFQPFETISK